MSYSDLISNEPRRSSDGSNTTIDAIREVHRRHPNILKGESLQRDSSGSTVDAVQEVRRRRPKDESLRSDSSGSTIDAGPRIIRPRRKAPCDSEISTTTRDDIRALCHERTYVNCPPSRPCDRPCYNPGVTRLSAAITPISDLHTFYTDNPGFVRFEMHRKDGIVTLQWEPFSCVLAAAGVLYLSVNQSIGNLPPYPMSWPIYILYKNVGRVTHIQVDPHTNNNNIRFYLNVDGSTGSGIAVGDAVSISGSSITWNIHG